MSGQGGREKRSGRNAKRGSRTSDTRASDARTRGAQSRDTRTRDAANEPSAQEIDAGADRSFEPTLADLGTPPANEPIPADVDSAPRHGGQEQASGPVPSSLVEIGRVVRLDRGYPLVVGSKAAHRAEHQISIVKSGEVTASVGDWVVLRHEPGHDKARIDKVFPRSSELSRWDGRQRGSRQTLAANVDLVLIAQQLSDRPLDLSRIARSAVLARQGGSRVAVVLTKADRVTRRDPRLDVDAVHELLGEQTSVCLTSVERAQGIEDVRALLIPGTVSLILGESGAGKSSLINALLGADVLGTAQVRGKDDAGRHTTVARRMLKVPQAGVLTDAPGLRSLALLDEYDGLARTFADIASLEQSCRFRDCRHADEPGCAVREAVEKGVVPAVQLQTYRALRDEMRANRLRLDPAAPSSLTS